MLLPSGAGEINILYLNIILESNRVLIRGLEIAAVLTILKFIDIYNFHIVPLTWFDWICLYIHTDLEVLHTAPQGRPSLVSLIRDAWDRRRRLECQLARVFVRKH